MFAEMHSSMALLIGIAPIPQPASIAQGAGFMAASSVNN